MSKEYSKHNLYSGRYKIHESGSIIPSESSYWIVLNHVGNGIFNQGETGKITLILSDSENSFWPVISFLDNDEARELANELLDRLPNERK